MLPYRESKFTKIILVIFFVLVLGYAYFEGQDIIFGPVITIENRVMTVDQPFITIEGSAHRIASLRMNGQMITVTEDGVFSEPYLLAPGYNKITLNASDRYGKSTERVIEIIYTPDSTHSTSSGQASSLQASSTSSAIAPEE